MNHIGPYYQCDKCGEWFVEHNGNVNEHYGYAICELCTVGISAVAKERFPEYPKGQRDAYHAYWRELALQEGR